MGDVMLQNFAMNNAAKRKIEAVARSLTTRLSDHQIFKGVSPHIKEREVTGICRLLMETVIPECVCLELTVSDSIYIVGDILGHHRHLLHIFDTFGAPPQAKYLFLGNYADVGSMGIETLTLLCAYKVLYPTSIYLLKGKHEIGLIGRDYGLLEECTKRFSQRSWQSFVTLFLYLPVAAIIDDRILCINGGLSPMLCAGISKVKKLKQIFRSHITKPEYVTRNSLLSHILWSSPDPGTKGWEQNPAGLGYLFGPDVVSQFCQSTGLAQIIRSGELVPKGYEFFTDPRLLTIFSAPDFMLTYGNHGALVRVQRVGWRDFRSRLIIMKPDLHSRNRPTIRNTVKFEEVSFQIGTGARRSMFIPPGSICARISSKDKLTA
ncbi:unnamed protein product [Calicophoron daubneyi]|uniref:Serine/threonine specific protein phosphatases domain-containing protein n=1 Tax=Calicophoron daubneyi TaxID=300641 RepID=A0AAV2T6M3_CALDB